VRSWRRWCHHSCQEPHAWLGHWVVFHEFSIWHDKESVFSRPWPRRIEQRTRAAMPANFCTSGLGEDTGGSIRLPSSLCGLVRLRPTPGLIGRKRLCPLIKTTDTPGPMACTFNDAALMLDILAGWWGRSMGSYCGDRRRAGMRKLRSEFNRNQNLLSRARVSVVRTTFGADSEPDCRAVKKGICSGPVAN
jgi:Asp-tRNA(Asn)/Glu-tRNA(Gln) amidotransferase A subunit family amidase